VFWEFNRWWPETVRRWRVEGLPPNIDPWQYFGFDKPLISIPINYMPIPSHFPRLLREDERYRYDMTPWGAITQSIKGESFDPARGTSFSGMPSYLEYPVKTRDDWEELKSRFDPYDPVRYPPYFWDELTEHYNSLTDRPVRIWGGSFYGWIRYFMGYKNLIVAFYKDPDWVHEMMDFFADFNIRLMEKAVRNIEVDVAIFWEDMAYKTGPHISPSMFQEFMLKNYKKVNGFLTSHGIKIRYVDSDGDIRPLIPLFIEGGINVVEPCEVQAGQDVVALREQYGKKIAFIGGVDKKAIIAGGNRLRKEVEKKIPVMKEGGYIPSCDHMVPVDVSLKNYKKYLELLKKHIHK
jgi:uroporphyrinogen decarboxylase